MTVVQYQLMDKVFAVYYVLFGVQPLFLKQRDQKEKRKSKEKKRETKQKIDKYQNRKVEYNFPGTEGFLRNGRFTSNTRSHTLFRHD